MLVPGIVGLIAVMLVCLTQSRQNGWGLKAAFVIIFIFLALRYDYGNDYMGYLRRFNEFASFYTRRQVDVSDMEWEPGWVLLNLVFAPFGFFTMVMFTSLLNCVVIYRFIRNFVPAPYQWLGMFLYVFDPYLFLVPASAMRQNMAIMLFLVGIELLYKKRFFVYYLLVFAGWSFHKSALALIPIGALTIINFKINKFIVVLCVCIYASMYLYGDQVFAFVTKVTGTLFQNYTENYYGGAKLGTGLGLVYSLFLFVGILYFAGLELTRSGGAECEGELPGQAEVFPGLAERRLLFKLAILSFMFTPLGFQVAMVGRINMYFVTVMIAVVPIIVFTTRNAFYRLMLLGSLIPFTLYKFVLFFGSAVWHKHFGTYQTILSQFDM